MEELTGAMNSSVSADETIAVVTVAQPSVTVTDEKGTVKRSKQERFTELAQARVSKLLYDLSRLENLSNRNNYDYTPEQVQAMFSAIQAELDAVRKQFEPKAKNTVFRF